MQQASFPISIKIVVETRYYIKFTLKTANGFESFGQMFIGNDKTTAYDIFSRLKGNEEVNETNILQLDFIETKEGLPVDLKVLHCTLNEMSENCKIITKEVFKYFNLR